MTGGYGKGPDIINSCTVNVERGEIVSILGPNSAGKSNDGSGKPVGWEIDEYIFKTFISSQRGREN